MKIGDIVFNANNSEYVLISDGRVEEGKEFVVTEFASLRVAGAENGKVLLGYKIHKANNIILQECNQEASEHTKELFNILINNLWFNRSEDYFKVRFIGKVG
jgi:hypothetical protein